MGIEILGFCEQIGIPPPPSPKEGNPRWSYDQEVDAFYVRLVDGMTPKQDKKSGQGLLAMDGSVVALELTI